MAYAAWIAAARCDALGGASGLTYSGRKRGSIPLTASNTDADTKATTRPVTFGAVPAVRTVVFITAIHSSTGSGVAADTRSGQAANSAAIDRKSTRLNSSHTVISYAVFCLKKKNT